MHIIGKISIVLGLALALISCSQDKGKAYKTDMKIIPENPIVITAPVIRNGTQINPPYFDFRVGMTNNTDEQVTLVAVLAEVSGIDASGAFKKTEYGFTPSDYDYTTADGAECTFSNFGTWDAGQSKDFVVTGSACGDIQDPVFTIGDNPKGPSGNSFRYRVKLKPLGYFGSYDVPTARFERFTTFFTQ